MALVVSAQPWDKGASFDARLSGAVWIQGRGLVMCVESVAGRWWEDAVIWGLGPKLAPAPTVCDADCHCQCPEAGMGLALPKESKAPL